MKDFILNPVLIIVGYVICHGLSANFMMPLQSAFFNEFNSLDSIAYMPHGIRILATMFFGWKAIVPLFLGGLIAEMLFTPDFIEVVKGPNVLPSLFVGSVSAFMAFEIFRAFGKDYYVSNERAPHWRQALLVGTLASLLNSIGQIYVFSGLFSINHVITVILCLVGDFFGFVLTFLALMLMFRWARLSGANAGD